MKKAVITGATGAIGLALIDVLLKHDVSLIVITRESSKRNQRIPHDSRVKIIYSDLSGLSNINIDERDVDVFFHLAWDGASGPGRNDMFLQTKNIEYSLDAVKLAKRMGCKVFVGAGSQAEYGLSSSKLSPNTATNPLTGYGFAKLCSGQMTRFLAQQEGIKHIWVRVLSVYGPNDGENSLISMLVTNMLRGESIKVTSCTQMWDYLFSYDAAEALYLLGAKGHDGKVYVLGKGDARPLREYVEDIKREMQSNVTIHYGAVPFSENQLTYLCADISEITNDVGWIPKVEFVDGIRRVIESK